MLGAQLPASAFTSAQQVDVGGRGGRFLRTRQTEHLRFPGNGIGRHWLQVMVNSGGHDSPWFLFTTLALQAVRVNSVDISAGKPGFFPSNGRYLHFPTAFIAQVHPSTIGFSERSVPPHPANPEPNGAVSSRGYLDRPGTPVRIALLADWQAPSSVRCREIPLLSPNGFCSLTCHTSVLVWLSWFCGWASTRLCFVNMEATIPASRSWDRACGPAVAKRRHRRR